MLVILLMSLPGPSPRCHLCRAPLAPGDAIFRPAGSDSFAVDDPCHGFVDVDLHWGCYATWPYRERFARVLFECAIAVAEDDPFRGVSACTQLVLVTLDPDPDVSAAGVVVARTGASYRVSLRRWQRWLAAPPAVHPCEQEALEEAVAPLRAELNTPDALLELSVWLGLERHLDRQRRAAQQRRERRRRDLEARQRASVEGLACPSCGALRHDHVFRDGAARRVPSSFVCASCGGPVAIG